MEKSKQNGEQKINASRRSFIRNSALSLASFYIVPRHVLGGRGYVAPSDKLLIAGIGAGGKGGDDIRHFAKSANAEIAFLCDVDDVRAKECINLFPKAKYYHDWRELYDKEGKNFDAVSVGTPDHNHAIIAFNAMQLKKHVYVQKPLTHDIYEARMLGEASKRYKVVSQMGDQGSSGDGVRLMREWYDAGLIGEVSTVDVWTDRPVWPQGIAWPKTTAQVPSTLQWDLWLGTAPQRDYINNLVPFNWRGWWDYGTGALGDMGCHLIGPVFKVLEPGSPTDVSCSVSTLYGGEFREDYLPDAGPVSSSVHFHYKKKNGKQLKMNWMDGGIKPEKPTLIPNNVRMAGNGVIFHGTKGIIICDVYGNSPQLYPQALNDRAKTLPQKLKRVVNGADGHYIQWVDACIAGYEKGTNMLSSPFETYAVPLTESILMGNLAIRSFNYRQQNADGKGSSFPARGLTLDWDAANMKVTNFDAANQYVKRTYRQGWKDLSF